MKEKITSMFLWATVVIISLIFGGRWVYDFYEKQQLKKYTEVVYSEKQDEIRLLGMQYDAILLDDPTYDYLRNYDFTVNIKEKLIGSHDRPFLFNGHLKDIYPEDDTHHILIEWQEPYIGREVYAYLTCRPDQVSELKSLAWNFRDIYAIAFFRDLKMVGFNQLFSEGSGHFAVFDGIILLTGELIDYTVYRSNNLVFDFVIPLDD